MKEHMRARLKELKAEFESGQRVLADLETQQANTRNTLLRISGAIQVLEEFLGETKPAEGNGARVLEMQPVLSSQHGVSETMMP